MPKKPKPGEYQTMQVRAEVLTLLREVEDLFQGQTGIRPTHSATFVNALTTYKAKLQAEPA